MRNSHQTKNKGNYSECEILNIKNIHISYFFQWLELLLQDKKHGKGIFPLTSCSSGTISPRQSNQQV